MVAGAALRRNTKASYATQQKHWAAICTRLHVPLDRPVTEQQLAAVAVVYCLTGHKVTTLPVFVAAVNDLSRTSFGGALPRGYLFSRVQAGLANIFAASNLSEAKTGVSIGQLAAIHSTLDFRRFDAARDWCLFLFAFYGLLRVSEYAGGSLLQRDVVAWKTGILLVVAFSKTKGTPVHLELSCRSDKLCPVRAYSAYCAFLGSTRLNPSAPFFFASASLRRSMADREVNVQLRLRLSAIGVTTVSDYAGHSFRRGGFSALCAAGVPFPLAQAHGRWKSLSYQRYLDTAHSAQLRLLATELLGERTAILD